MRAAVSAPQACALPLLPAEREPCGAQLLSNIPVYRWLCFAAMLVPAGYAAVLVVKALLWVLEDKYFLTSNVVFHIIAVRVRAHPLQRQRRLICECLRQDVSGITYSIHNYVSAFHRD